MLGPPAGRSAPGVPSVPAGPTRGASLAPLAATIYAPRPMSEPLSEPQVPGPPAGPELPPPPERPDCCLGGCAVCVLEGYPEELERWELEVAAIKERYLAELERTG